MTSYTNVFGGDAIWPTRVSYIALSLTSNTTLSWGYEGSSNVVADIMDVSSDAARDLTMPDARKGSPGIAVLINNTGAYTITVKDNGGSQIVTVPSATCYTLYLKTNTTAAGTWGYIEFGATASTSQAADLDGSGLVALSGTLNLKFDVQTFNTNYTTGLSDRAKVLSWTGGSGTLTLPDPSTMTDSWFVLVKNDGSGTLTVSPAAGTIDGAGSISLAATDSMFVVTDSVEYLSVGRGRSIQTAIDYISINVAGSGDYTLSAGQQDKIIYNLTGALTGNRSIIVPASVQEYWIANDTSGAFTLTVKTASGTGPTVAQGQRAILYCDGTNVIAATSAISTPVAVADGGTGATTASAARTNLGASSIGATIFTAANEAAVRTALSLTVGTDVQAYDSDLAALASNSTNGIWARTGTGTGAARTITGTSNEITVTNGNGGSGNPTLSLPSAITLTGKTITGGTFSSPIISSISNTGTITLPTSTDTLVGRATTDTLTNKTLTNPTITNYVETVYTVSGTAVTVSLANGTIQKITSTGNLTITLPSSVAGKSFLIIVAYGGTHTLTWAGGSTIKWAGGSAPTATSTNAKFDIFAFFQDGTNTYGSAVGLNF